MALYDKGYTEDEIIERIRENAYELRYVREKQTERICIEAVTKNPYSIVYVHNLTENIINAALSVSDSLASADIQNYI